MISTTLPKSPLTMPLDPPKGYQLKWMRHKVLKDDLIEDEANIEHVKQAGWLPVAPCMYPDMPTEKGRIECDGLVLYMKTKRDLDHYDEMMEAQAKQILDLKFNSGLNITNLDLEEAKCDIIERIKSDMCDNRVLRTKFLNDKFFTTNVTLWAMFITFCFAQPFVSKFVDYIFQ